MSISSRTPEGEPHLCPVCGEVTRLECSLFTGDSCCPRCGQLLWRFRHRLQTAWQLDVDLIQPHTRLTELGADSLDTVELVMELEEELDLNIPDEAAEKLQTVADVLRYVLQHRGDRDVDS